MIIVLGSIIVKEGCVEKALKISQQHVNRSRGEPGCIAHDVHIDSENSQRLVFVEKWSDQASLTQHFKEATSISFVNKIKEVVTNQPEMAVYDATQLP